MNFTNIANFINKIFKMKIMSHFMNDDKITFLFFPVNMKLYNCLLFNFHFCSTILEKYIHYKKKHLKNKDILIYKQILQNVFKKLLILILYFYVYITHSNAQEFFNGKIYKLFSYLYKFC